MIPKIIHYCWFGRNPLPPLAKKCIASWKKHLPEYEIKEWNEDNFDVNIIPYTKEAYSAKKYAFVSDYARFWILYQYGGLYFDTDVEIIRPMDKIIERGAFMGLERDYIPGATAQCAVAPGLGLGCNPGLGLYKEIIDFYSTIHFINDDNSYNQTTVVQYTTDLLIKNGLEKRKGIQKVGEIYIYPKEYFNPISQNFKLQITENTVSIHHYAGSWLPKKKLLKKHIIKLLGSRLTSIAVRLKLFLKTLN